MTTRERIKAEAMGLFVARGVDAVSVRDIADAVGMKASNLYAHFSGKAALIAELVAEGDAAYAAELAEVTGPTAVGRLDAMVHRICALHDRDTLRFRFLLLTQHGPTAARTPTDQVQGVVTAGMADGEIPRGDPALVTAMLVGMVIQAATFRLYGRLDRSMTDMADEIALACRLVLVTNKEDR